MLTHTKLKSINLYIVEKQTVEGFDLRPLIKYSYPYDVPGKTNTKYI